LGGILFMIPRWLDAFVSASWLCIWAHEPRGHGGCFATRLLRLPAPSSACTSTQKVTAYTVHTHRCKKSKNRQARVSIVLKTYHQQAISRIEFALICTDVW